ncbi:MAG: diacylglycerol kinase family protein [SAR324 cluster bacterium]|nr:diacylglycerol kinase family protein [SAR324 cluster bacterium]
MGETTCIVLNPSGHGRATGRAWQSCQRRCLRELAPVEISVVKNAQEAKEAAREAALRGFEKVVAVGGTATTHGALNGLMTLAADHRKATKFGVLSLVRAQEWSRTLRMPRELNRQLEAIRAGHVLPFDVGRADCLDDEGRPLTRYFLNGACFGISTRLRHDLQLTQQDPAEGLSAMARSLRLLLSKEDPWVRMVQGGREIYRGPWVAGLLMVGRYYPWFGEVAPRADPVDGSLDLVGVTGRLGLRSLAMLSGLFPWRRGHRRDFTIDKGVRFTATDITGPVYLELDGIAVGTLPATFTLLPRQISMIVPSVPVRTMKPHFKSISELAEGPVAAEHLKAGWGH